MARTLAIPFLAIVIAITCFVLFALAQGVGLNGLYSALYYGVLTNSNFLTQTFVKAVPLICAMLAVIVPARAGLVNVGGEGQLVVGAVAGTGTAVAFSNSGLGVFGIIATILVSALAGGVWGYLCAAMKTGLHAPEAVTTLLTNFIATDIMLFLLYSSWKDPKGSGQPQSRPVPRFLRMGNVFGIPVAFIIVICLCVAIWCLLDKSSWGFSARVVGSNPEAAFRSGLSVNRYAQSAMFIGGALAGIGGALNILGAEGQLRPGITTTFGFIAFLAAFIAKGNVLAGTIYATVAAAVLVAGNPLQLRAGLDGNATYVLLGVTCLAIVVISQRITRRTS
ncbi:ABC transporter permease [Bifidobacterium subtile]|uniref:ABC transporter permease n=1 Tax=Bifidobacterium subtile TaxID=77635 RepID=UPI0013776505|nr:ABC transporter permease [Bifidobacterium subtile]QOL36786.1 ABC transporter permease [Bifidobacterium subtile]